MNPAIAWTNKTLLVALLAIATPGAPTFAQSAAADFVSATRYDAKRRVTGTIAPDPDGAGPLRFAAVRNSYDDPGNLVKVEKGELAAWQPEAVAPAAWTDFTVHQAIDSVYDLMGRKLRESLSGRDPATGLMVVQTVTQTSYDPLGRVACVATRMNPATFASLPGSACTPAPVQATFGPDRITRNRYDQAGRLARVETGVGTSERRDLALYTYTANGRMASLTDARGYRAEMRHDGHDRQARWVFPSKTIPGRADEADYEEYGWDPAGNRISLRNRAGETLNYSYDALNRMTLKDRPGAEPDVAYAYDLRGLQLSASFPSTGEAVTNQFDKAGRLTSTTTTMGGAARTLTFRYDANSNRTRITHPDGMHFDYDHDGLDRVKTIVEGDGEPGEFLLATFTYDPLGRRKRLVRGNGTVTDYAYDLASRLSQQTDDYAGSSADQLVTLAYNPASQLTVRTGSNDIYAWTGLVAGTTATSLNGQNQIMTNGGVAFSHDAKGNLTSDGSGLFTYSSENLLSTVKLPGIAVRTQRYDPLMRLHEASASASRFVYDGQRLVVEYAPAGAVARRHVHGPAVDESLVWYEGTTSATRRYQHADERGSLVMVSTAAGAAWNVNRYDEYGNAPPGLDYRFQFTGQMWIPEIKLLYYKARFYDPKLGRFMQVDPAGYGGGPNLYRYVRNDPINLVDPEGTIPVPGCIGCHMTNKPSRTPQTVPAPQPPSIKPGFIDQLRDAAINVCVTNPACSLIVLVAERLTGDDVEIPGKVGEQLGDRGWTEEEVRDLTRGEPAGTSTDNTGGENRRNDPATVYGDRDRYVVVNDKTGEVIQVSDKKDPNWKPDPRINWRE